MASMKMGNERAFPLPPPDFSSLRRKVLELYRLGLYREALDLALQARGHFPTKESDIAFWIACLLSRLGETEKALSTLAEALDQGHWWGERLLLHDPDLEPLRDRPEFARILAVSKQRQEKAQAKAEPLLVVRPPKGGRGAKGLVITLHWYMGTAEEFAKYWETLEDMGFLLALPQSSQVVGEGNFGWDNGDLARKELSAHWETLRRAYTFEQSCVILAGASQGGRLAIELALEGKPIPARGFIAVAPAIRDPEGLAQLAQSAAQRGLRGILIIGEHDHFLPATEKFWTYACAAGLPCELRKIPGLGHDFPEDFPAELKTALDFLFSQTAKEE